MMLPILLILFAMLLTQKEKIEVHFSPRVLEKLQVDSDQFSTKIRNVFYFLMLLFMIIALAGPVIEKGSAKTDVKNDTVYVALGLDAGVEKSTKALIKTLEKLDRLKVGVVVYAEESYLLSPPTSDYSFIRSQLNDLPSFGGALDTYRLMDALKKLWEPEKRKQLIILVDEKARFKLAQYQQELQKSVDTLYIVSREDILVDRLNRLSSQVEVAEKPIYFYLFVIPIGLSMLMFILASSSFHRGEKYYLPQLLLLSMLFFSEKAEAGYLDYRELERAAQFYDDRMFSSSAKVFERYGLQYESKEAIYNAANCFYKMGDYKRAVALYRSIHFVDPLSNQMLYHNLGNALVRLHDMERLREAEKAYRKSLKYRYDQETAENLEAVSSYLNRIKRESVTSTMDAHTSQKYQKETVQKENTKSALLTPEDKSKVHLYKILP